jgi:hypothetical protein
MGEGTSLPSNKATCGGGPEAWTSFMSNPGEKIWISSHRKSPTVCKKRECRIFFSQFFL